ncbi:MAG: formate dehydrogenase, partial [Phycisphaeraceae bacterium]|nr:formate dehydrogenase [Phycisphaeraceae bacterium]
MSESISLTIDGRPVTVSPELTIWEASRQSGIDIPALCHDPDLPPVGVCRMCVVDVGGRVLAASCVRKVEPGMEVTTRGDGIDRHRRMLTELLLADQPAPDRDARQTTTGDNRLFELADDLGVRESRFGTCTARGRDDSSPVIAVDHQACILCDRCIRACDDVQCNEVMGRTGKGYGSRIAFDLDTPMGASTCVSCGQCAAACPTGALTHKAITVQPKPRTELEPVDSVCPYCGVGCALTFQVDRAVNRIAYVDARDGGSNHFRLCVKGRYGFDYASHGQRLTQPLIRRDSHYPKGPLSSDVRGDDTGRGRKPGGLVDYDEVMPAFRPATWDEALDLAAQRLKEIRDRDGGGALAGFGSAKCSNEEAYLFQKMVRAVFGTNNVDHCTRLCHASSVAALMETIGSGAVTNTFSDIARADLAILTGTNTTANHPVAATFFKQAAKRGTRLVVVDPRRPDVADHAWRYCRIKPGSDVAFYNGLMHVLIDEGLVDDAFVRDRTEGFDDLARLVQQYTPQRAAKLCGVEAETIVEVARAIGGAGAMMVFWGMGISQHTHGTDNARCLISLCLLTGNVGRPGTGLHPLRGQNNVQGASDAGLIPMVFPDYQPVGDDGIRAKFESAWGVPLDPKPGLTVVEITRGALEGRIRGMYMLGENPFISDPNINKVRKALSSLEFLVVQDIFLTETAEFADVILPASSFMEKTGTYTNTDRRVQIGRTALDPPGDARLDWQIICDLSRRMGYQMSYEAPDEIFAEFAGLTKNYDGLDYRVLGERGRLWPCPDPSRDGEQILFGASFPSGRGRLVPCEGLPAKELPDDEYPFVLNTGRLLEHWHTGSMTRRSKALDAIRPRAEVAVHPDDLARLEIESG